MRRADDHARGQEPEGRRLQQSKAQYKGDRRHLAVTGKTPSERVRELSRPSQLVRNLSRLIHSCPLFYVDYG
jgi:hypothetical protein